MQGVLGNGAVVVKATAPAELDSGVANVPHHHSSWGTRWTCTKRSEHCGSELGSVKLEPTSSRLVWAGAVPIWAAEGATHIHPSGRARNGAVGEAWGWGSGRDVFEAGGVKEALA